MVDALPLYYRHLFVDTLPDVSIITSLAKELGYVFGSVGLSLCLWTTLLKKLQMDWDEILWRGPG